MVHDQGADEAKGAHRNLYLLLQSDLAQERVFTIVVRQFRSLLFLVETSPQGFSLDADLFVL